MAESTRRPVSDPERSGGGVAVESFQTDDVQAAETYLRRVYPSAELRESKRAFRFQQSTRSEGGIGFTRFRLSSWTDITVEFDEVAGFGMLLAGDYSAKLNETALDADRPFVFTPGSGRSRSEHLDLLMVNIDLRTLAAFASTSADAEPATARFVRTAPASKALETHWRHTLAYAWNGVLEVEELFRNDLTRAATFDTVLAAAVAAFQITGVAGDADRSRPAVPSRAVRAAQEYVDAHVDSALTVQQIAAAAGVSVRALQLGFQRDLRSTPLQYVRRRRLEAARAALLAAGPDEMLISELAQRWGFTNSGRFTAQYAALFGELPSVTLRS
jgi:AraC-like DNA-binding protein